MDSQVPRRFFLERLAHHSFPLTPPRMVGSELQLPPCLQHLHHTKPAFHSSPLSLSIAPGEYSSHLMLASHLRLLSTTWPRTTDTPPTCPTTSPQSLCAELQLGFACPNARLLTLPTQKTTSVSPPYLGKWRSESSSPKSRKRIKDKIQIRIFHIDIFFDLQILLIFCLTLTRIALNSCTMLVAQTCVPHTIHTQLQQSMPAWGTRTQCKVQPGALAELEPGTLPRRQTLGSVPRHSSCLHHSD